MNKRYSFSGKRTDNGEWVTGNLCYGQRGQYYITIFGLFEKRRVLKCKGYFEVDSGTIGQCTGEKVNKPPYDKYFYENDIVIAYWYEGKKLVKDVMVIQFRHGAFVGLSATKHAPRPIQDIAERGGEIIGNIHDNPELLQNTASIIGYADESALAPATCCKSLPKILN